MGNKFGKSLANIRQASEQTSKLTSKNASKQASNSALDFSLDEGMEAKEQVIVSFRTAPVNRKAIRQAALDRDLSVSDLVKAAIEQYLQVEADER
ncbi:MAG: hypothetical protein AAGE92_05580 [Cyanobacteria bacterium P01_G01_bin.4]